MKYAVIILLSLKLFSCKAQIAVPLYNADPDLPEGVYYKDMDNDLNKFVGTWKWENNNDSLIIVLQKKSQVYNSTGHFYEDMIIGEYRYIENGIEILNSISRLQENNVVGCSHYISGNIIHHKNHPPECVPCTINERRVLLYYFEPLTINIFSKMVVRHIIDQGVEKIEIKLYTTYIRGYDVPGNAQQTIVPNGEYTLIKQ